MTHDSPTLIQTTEIADEDSADSLLGVMRFEVAYTFEICPEDEPRKDDLWILQVRLILDGQPGPLVYDCGYATTIPPVDRLAGGAIDRIEELVWQDWSQRAAYLDEPYDN